MRLWTVHSYKPHNPRLASTFPTSHGVSDDGVFDRSKRIKRACMKSDDSYEFGRTHLGCNSSQPQQGSRQPARRLACEGIHRHASKAQIVLSRRSKPLGIPCGPHNSEQSQHLHSHAARQSRGPVYRTPQHMAKSKVSLAITRGSHAVVITRDKHNTDFFPGPRWPERECFQGQEERQPHVHTHVRVRP